MFDTTFLKNGMPINIFLFAVSQYLAAVDLRPLELFASILPQARYKSIKFYVHTTQACHSDY